MQHDLIRQCGFVTLDHNQQEHEAAYHKNHGKAKKVRHGAPTEAGPHNKHDVIVAEKALLVIHLECIYTLGQENIWEKVGATLLLYILGSS
jgi:hypothetical protein